ncbi:MAG: glycosyltransferase family 2 protein, partial [Thermoleophilia bacterium]
MLGLFGFPYFFIFELLSAPIELLGIPLIFVGYIMGTMDIPFFILFLGVAIVWGMCISSFSLLLSELSFERYRMKNAGLELFLAAFFENFGYRQLHAFWRVRGMVRYFLTRDTEWGKLDREKYLRGEGGAQ